MEDKTSILLLVAGMRKEVQGLVSEVRCTCAFFININIVSGVKEADIPLLYCAEFLVYISFYPTTLMILCFQLPDAGPLFVIINISTRIHVVCKCSFN